MDLDRVTPAQRIACRTRQTGEQTWRDLLFLHWEVPASTLRSLVPASLSIDTFEGRAYVGLVPFTMQGVRFGPVSVADFLETNLRTYVHAEGVPGVWFFSLDAASALATWGGRSLYRLPYFRASTGCVASDGSYDYRSQRRGATDAALQVQWSLCEPEPHAALPGTLEYFLTERYALYGPAGDRGSYRIRVHHPPWPLRRAQLAELRTSIPSAAKLQVGEPIDLVLASPEGVRVETFAREAVSAAHQ